MHFEGSSNVTLLFDFWDVHGPAGMVLSVFVVLLLTVLYELLKVWKIWLGESSFPVAAPQPPSPPSPTESLGSSAALTNPPSEASLAPPRRATPVKSWLVHGLQTCIHMVHVTLGYMLMLCVMSYNIWIFIGVIVGSAFGYFLAIPLLGQF